MSELLEYLDEEPESPKPKARKPKKTPPPEFKQDGSWHPNTQTALAIRELLRMPFIKIKKPTIINGLKGVRDEIERWIEKIEESK